MGFPNTDRQLLLRISGIGPTVLQRLEDAGFHSLAAIQALGVDHVVEVIVKQVPGDAWRNRRGALERALRAWSGNSASVRP